MTEAPDAYPDLPDEEESQEPDAQSVDVAERERGAEDVRTGDVRVDAVLASLGGLDERPLGEHVSVFESAHEQLRTALEPDQEPDRQSSRESA